MKEPSTAVVHFYRAAVGHADIWRQRTDATTNWTVVSTAALVTFTFSSADNPHFILLVGFAFDVFFLVMESRRYQVFQRWRQNVHELNRWIMAPSLAPRLAPSEDEITAGLERLACELGNTQPRISFLEAVGYRTRRNYGFVFLVVLLTWLLKLWYHPTPGASMTEIVSRASVGALGGEVILTFVFASVSVLTYLAIVAPSERMENWETIGSPMYRFVKDARGRIPEIKNGESPVTSEADEMDSEQQPAEDVIIDEDTHADDAPAEDDGEARVRAEVETD